MTDSDVPDDFSRETTIETIRGEASSRIAEFCPFWQQLNMVRRLRELEKIEASGQDMTEYQAEITLINDKFSEIDRLRGRSDALEAVLPHDIADDKYW